MKIKIMKKSDPQIISSATSLDSLLLLSASLNKLAEKSYDLPSKLEFNHELSNTADLYDTTFRDKLLDYNIQDVVLLHKIIIKFSQDLKALFNITLGDTPTISSLAFKIYKLRYMKDNKQKVSITTLRFYDEIREAYRGGSVDVFRCHGHNLYYYDINSLYPYIMSNSPLPVGDHITVFGDFDITKFNGLGLFYVTVEAPLGLNVPILLHRVNGTSVAGVGTWTSWYTCIELKMALELGYKIKVIKGHIWDKSAILFEGYVKDIYKLRLTYDKKDPKNLICKLLLNSLYGRFGMSPRGMDYKLVSPNYPLKQLPLDVIDLGSGYTLQGFTALKNTDGGESLDISTPVAVFITAYARIHMAKYKYIYQDSLFYSDTDSIIMDKPLPDYEVGDELGKVKLEYKVEEGIFIAPKVYGIKTKKGDFIKIKGSNKSISLDALRGLLLENSQVIINNEKWFRRLEESDIKIVNQPFTIKATDFKRRLVYENGLLVQTKPFVIDNDKICEGEDPNYNEGYKIKMSNFVYRFNFVFIYI